MTSRSSALGGCTCPARLPHSGRARCSSFRFCSIERVLPTLPGRASIFIGARINAAAEIYDGQLARLRAELSESGADVVGLAKDTSNLFRNRAARARPKIDLSGFNQVLAVNPAAGTLGCRAMTTYDDLLQATLAQ